MSSQNNSTDNDGVSAKIVPRDTVLENIVANEEPKEEVKNDSILK